MRVTKLVRREPPPDPGVSGKPAQLGSRGGRGPPAPAGGSVDDAEQRSGRERHAVGQPGGELLEPELIHPCLAAFVALAVADQQRPALLVDVGLVERQTPRRSAARHATGQRSAPGP